MIERIDAERRLLAEAIADAEARLTEWTATPTADAALDFYNRIVDVVAGRVAQADGIAEINAVLHDSLLGVSLGFDGRTLTADIQVRPSGWTTTTWPWPNCSARFPPGTVPGGIPRRANNLQTTNLPPRYRQRRDHRRRPLPPSTDDPSQRIAPGLTPIASKALVAQSSSRFSLPGPGRMRWRKGLK